MRSIRFFVLCCSFLFFSSCKNGPKNSSADEETEFSTPIAKQNAFVRKNLIHANVDFLQDHYPNKKEWPSIAEACPEFKMMQQFSERILPKTNLVLISYGVNNSKPKGYKFKNCVRDFGICYRVYTTQQNFISLGTARQLLVSVTEALLKEINSNVLIRPDLDTYPMTSDFLRIEIYFEDENHIKLGNGGVTSVYFAEGKIKYWRYEIYEYTNRVSLPGGITIHDEVNGKFRSYKITNPLPPAGEYFPLHRESYAEALEIVKEQDGLLPL